MAKNDIVLIDGIIEQRLKDRNPSTERDEVFEFFVFEEVLKDYELSKDEIESGWIDGRGDGGFDAAYILINGHLLEDVEQFNWPRSHASLEIILITCKLHSTFSQSTLDAILASIGELFDLGRDSENLQGHYSEMVLEFREKLIFSLRRLSIGRPSVSFSIYYSSRGDTNQIGSEVIARSRQIEVAIDALFSACSAKFHFVGSGELVEMHRKARRFALELPFLEHLATGKDSYVLLVKLSEYRKFVTDENKTLRRYLFDSNVRDYLGGDGVNEDIALSLADASAPDFWWLNNGVTILATNATVPGKIIQLQDIQIVNGLQTTETIFRHFQDGASSPSNDRALLVKIVVSSDPQIRDRIIRATNNQSPVEVAALRATDKIQRDIEAILEQYDWFYERRKNYYRNIGKPEGRFVTPSYIASAVVALVFKNVSQATRLKSKFMRNQLSYNSVFSSELPIQIWPVLVSVYKSVEACLTQLPSVKRRGERFNRNWRSVVSLAAVARRIGTFAFTVGELAAMGPALVINPSEVEEIWKVIVDTQGKHDWTDRASASFYKRVICEVARLFELPGVETVGRRRISTVDESVTPPTPLSPKFVDQVNALLPPQPWKPGIHVEIAEKLRCSSRDASRAISVLIKQRKRMKQRGGVVLGSVEEV